MADIIRNLIIQYLNWARITIKFLPAQPVTLIIYCILALYGYKSLIKREGRISAFADSLCLLGFIVFMFSENTWLFVDFIRFPYMATPFQWFASLMKNLIFGFVFLSFLRKDMKVNIIKESIPIVALFFVYNLCIFFVSPSYAYLDWAYSLAYNYPQEIAIIGFLFGLGNKPILSFGYKRLLTHGETK
jgi:hypothetical protein